MLPTTGAAPKEVVPKVVGATVDAANWAGAAKAVVAGAAYCTGAAAIMGACCVVKLRWSRYEVGQVMQSVKAERRTSYEVKV